MPDRVYSCQGILGRGTRRPTVSRNAPDRPGSPTKRRPMSRPFWLFPFILAAAAAQQFPSNSVHVRDGVVTGVYGPPRAITVVAGAPYAAEQLQEYAPP